MYVPIQGFAPDADPTEPGVLLDCDLLIPTIRGMKAQPADASSGLLTAPSSVAAMFSFEQTDNTQRLIGGTEGSGSAATAQLYDVDITSGWVDRGGAGSPYTATAAARWTFANYGDTVYAGQKGTQLLKSTGAGTAFTAVAGAPQPSFIVSVLDFLVAFNTTDATYGNSPNRWWCSAAGNTDSWTADIATQATTGLLTDTTGGITAAGTIGSNLVAFKERAAYLGQYVGPPVVWGWTRIPGEGLGAWSHYSVVDVEGVGLLFPGRDNFYIFDGSRATPIGTNRVAEYFFLSLDALNSHKMIGFHARREWNVYWYYPDGNASGELNRFLVYNYRSNRWGFGRKTVSFVFEYLQPAMTWDDIGSFYSTWNDFPAVPYDQLFAARDAYRPASVSTSGVLSTTDGVAGTSSYQTGAIGIDGMVNVLTRIRPRFRDAPDTGTQLHTYLDQLGGTETTSNASTTMTDGAFDHVFAARWHKAKHTYTGDMEILGLDVEVKPDSLE